MAASGEVGLGWGRSKRKLHDAASCRQEASRVYRLAAQGRIGVEEMTRAVYGLTQIARLAEQAELEARIATLEAALAARKGRP